MGPYYNVHLTLGKAIKDFPLFLGGLVTVHQGYVHREGSKAFLEVLVVLCRKDGGGHQNGHLFLGAHALEGGPHGYFGLSKAHITANQAVHGAPTFHVPLDVFGSLHLVRRRLVLEGVLEFLLQLAIGRESETFHQFPAGIKFHQVPCNLHHLLLDPLFEGIPVLAPQLIQLGRFLFGNIQAVDFLQIRHGELETVATAVFQQGAVHHTAVHLHADKTQVPTHAVVLVGHVVPAVQGFHHQGRGHGPGNLPLAALARMSIENAGLRQEGNLVAL